MTMEYICAAMRCRNRREGNRGGGGLNRHLRQTILSARRRAARPDPVQRVYRLGRNEPHVPLVVADGPIPSTSSLPTTLTCRPLPRRATHQPRIPVGEEWLAGRRRGAWPKRQGTTAPRVTRSSARRRGGAPNTVLGRRALRTVRRTCRVFSKLTSVPRLQRGTRGDDSATAGAKRIEDFESSPSKKRCRPTRLGRTLRGRSCTAEPPPPPPVCAD